MVKNNQGECLIASIQTRTRIHFSVRENEELIKKVRRQEKRWKPLVLLSFNFYY